MSWGEYSGLSRWATYNQKGPYKWEVGGPKWRKKWYDYRIQQLRVKKTEVAVSSKMEEGASSQTIRWLLEAGSESERCSVVSDSLPPHGLYSPGVAKSQTQLSDFHFLFTVFFTCKSWDDTLSSGACPLATLGLSGTAWEVFHIFAPIWDQKKTKAPFRKIFEDLYILPR